MSVLLRTEPLDWWHLTWPRTVDAKDVTSALLSVHGLATPRRRDTLVLETVGRQGRTDHRIGVPRSRSNALRRQLAGAIGGLALLPLEGLPELSVQRAWRAWLSTKARPLIAHDPEVIARALLVALAAAGNSEELVLQVLLGPVLRPLAVGTRVPADRTLSLAGVLTAPFIGPDELDAPARLALAAKQGVPGWRVVLRIGVKARSVRRQRQLLGQVAAACRMAQGPGVQLGFRPCPVSVIRKRRLPVWWPLALNVNEFTALAGWPIGETAALPVASTRSTRLPVPRSVPHRGRIIGESAVPGEKQPVAISVPDSLRHLHVVGPSGTGKSTLLLNLVCQDMQAGRGVVVVEPKGDLIRDVLERVPAQRLDDVVVIDPTDEAPTGINALAQAGFSPELVVDQLLHVLKRLNADSWGPRTQDLLSAGLLTLVRQPGMSLAALPLLFTDAGFRSRLLARVNDPLALGPFWEWFEALSIAERQAVLAPLMNKLRPFLLRERVRRVVGQPEPRFDLRDAVAGRRIVLVSLARGSLGQEAASLLGALVMGQLWHGVQGRSALPPGKRHPVMLVVDEFQDYLALPTDLGEALAQARGLGVGLTLAHQHLAQLPPAIRAAVLANAQSRVIFSASYDDANVLARGSNITAEDITGLCRYEAYASVLASGEPTPFASIRTLPPPSPIRPADEARALSRDRYGVPGVEIDAALTRLASGTPAEKAPAAVALGVKPRRRPERAGETGGAS